ncbi:hypothetical protein FRC10_000431 [Ceratobasidium sp. 414]|nr:hypothetical protein FRC10_000431 [Ceratobasidium sp. 414]
MSTHVPGIKFSLFTGSNRHPWSLNERHLMLVLGNMWLGLVYSLWDAVVNRNPSWLRRFISTALMWDIAGVWFEVNASQVIHLSQFKEDPNASLIAGLQSKDEYFKTSGLIPRPGSRIHNLVSSQAPEAIAAPLRPAPSSKISKDPVYKTASSTPLDTIVGAANAVVTVVPANLSVPAIFLSSSHSQPAVSAPVQIPLPIQGWKLPKLDFSPVMGILPPSVALWLRWAWDVLFVERQDAKLEALLRNRAADVWAIEALSALVMHSLQEDPYGRVQRDIPRVLEALVSYLGALEQLIEETNASPTPKTEDTIKTVVQPVAEGPFL